MNESLKKAMRSVFAELSNMSPEELMEEINNTPSGGIGECLAYAGAHEIFLDGKTHNDSISYKMEATAHEAKNAADYEVNYYVEDMTWLIAA